ncbi:hypothetical protein Hypma_008539 [Hypsizygus marmoreus]|uniref:Tyr recombinase domain-containing protein n=1 Tax=Hypsizygus marmoreus TaxID=39966 RepID=A0A369JVB8_HYPMA|nr:hypothetical protein Hypma_008539 [Hypsizygus marmoreus]
MRVSNQSASRTRHPRLSPTAVPPPTTLAALNRVQAAAREEFGQPKTTRSSYTGYLKRGKKFLAQLVADRCARNTDDGVDTDLLEKAFDNPPNKYSVLALDAYLAQKCFNENCGKDTAGGIQGAFTDLWDHMDEHGYYSGDYEYDERTETVKGCPARALSFKSMVRIVNKRARVTGAAATRNYAEAMDLPALTMAMAWSQAQYPSEKLKHPPKDATEKALALRQAEGRAMFSTGFNTWARNFELTALRACHITRDSVGPGPHYHPCIRVFLEHRKGWESKGEWDGPLESKHYNIYPQDIPALDMYTHLRKWLDYLESTIGRPLEPEEFIFPFISSNGAIHLNRSMSRDVVQSFINDFTKGAGLPKYYTTHCFQRGGAQYRFTQAPMGERWSLKAVRWWGGWAPGESVDTLMKYLFNSLQSYESSYCDQLCPSGLPDHDQSFMGERRLVQPATTHDLQVFTSRLLSAIQQSHSMSANNYPAITSPRVTADCQPSVGTNVDAPALNLSNVTDTSPILSAPATFINSTGWGLSPDSSSTPGAAGLTTVDRSSASTSPIIANPLVGASPIIPNPYIFNGNAPLPSAPSTLGEYDPYALNHGGFPEPNFAPEQNAGASSTGFRLFNPPTHPSSWSHLTTSAFARNAIPFVPGAPVCVSEPENSISSSSRCHPRHTNNILPFTSHRGVNHPGPHHSSSSLGPTHSGPLLASSTLALNQCHSAASPAASRIPLAAIAVIPDLDRGHKGGWRQAVFQWENVDPQTGKALKDWPWEWYQDEMRMMSPKRRTRKVVALEYRRLGGTEDKFLAAHPEADTIGFLKLCDKISEQNERHHRRSKNGSPEARRRRVS